MKATKALLSILTLISALRLPAEPPSTPALAPAELKAKVQLEGGPGLSPAIRAYLTVGTNRLAFLVPSGFGLQVVEGRRACLFQPDYRCSISVQVLEPGTPDGKRLDADVSYRTVLESYPGATIRSPLNPTLCGSPGFGFDLDWVAAGNLLRRSRVVMAETTAGVIEVSLTCSPEHFGAAQRAYNTVLLTLAASGRGGALKIAPLSSNL